jgi:hypothetical protein
LFKNLFQPSFKLKSSERDGGRIRRRNHPQRTPLQRLLATSQVSEERADQLRELQRGSDPLVLLETILRCQGRLAVLASGAPGRGPRPGPPSGGGPDTAPWGLALRAGREEQANSPELKTEAVLKTALGNREQGRRGCSHEHLAKPSFSAMPLPWARKPQCYQVTTAPGNNLLIQSAPQPDWRGSD